MMSRLSSYVPNQASFKGLFHRNFVRNVFVLMTGTTIAMVIPLVASPALTRLYSPRDYGVFAVFVSIISIIAVPITANSGEHK